VRVGWISKPGRRLRAQELATKGIEKIIDPAAPPEERDERSRRPASSPAPTCRRSGGRESPEPLTINGKTIADFTRVVEQTGILERGTKAGPARNIAPTGTSGLNDEGSTGGTLTLQ
jgi:hypothetical protein